MFGINVPFADQQVNHLAQAVATFGCLITTIILFWFAVRDARRHGSWVGVLMLVGCGLSAVLEPLYDNAFRLHWYTQGQWNLYSSFGLAEPIWIALAYMATYGTYSWLFYTRVRDGASAASLLTLLVVIIVTMELFEAGFTNGGVYEYFGDNPFRLFGLPAWIELPNLAVSFITGITALAVEQKLRGNARGLAAFLAFPLMFSGVTYTTAVPILDLINAPVAVPAVYLWLAATLTMALAVAVIWLGFQIIPLLQANLQGVKTVARRQPDPQTAAHAA